MMDRKTYTEVTSPKSRMSTNSIMPAYEPALLHQLFFADTTGIVAHFS